MSYDLTFHPTPSGPTGEYRVQQLTELFDAFVAKLEKQAAVQRVDVTFDQPKNAKGKVVAVNVMIRVQLFSGKAYVAKSGQYVEKAKHVGLETSVRDALKELAEQVRRDHTR